MGLRSYDLTDFSALPVIPNNPPVFRQIRAGVNNGVNNKLYVTDPPQGPSSYYLGLYEIDAITGELSAIRIAGSSESIGALIDTSPDGKYLYAQFTQGLTTINRYDISTGTPVLLTPTLTYSNPNLSSLQVSPDGKFISFRSDGGGDYATIFVTPSTSRRPFGIGQILGR